MSKTLYRAPLDEDLRPLSALLFQRQVMHRIVEEGGEQVVQLLQTDDTDRATELLNAWREGEIRVSLRHRARPAVAPKSAAVGLSFSRYPVTLALIGLSILGFLLVYVLRSTETIALLSFNGFEVIAGRAQFTESSGEVWRFITPVFLHFGWMHIVFNSLWCWDLGRRIEAALGSLNLFGLFLAIAFVSNTAQDIVAGPVLFGGLSGVVYGFLGFAFTAGRLNARWQHLAPPTPVMLFMVGWLVFCMSGLVNVLGFSVANTAHAAGLLTGGAIGTIFAFSFRGKT